MRSVYVGRDDQAAVLACFDETAGIVFSALCQLCGGDAELAVEMLAETYTYLARMAASSYGVDVDRRWMIDAAHSVYAAHAPKPGRNEIGPVAALAPTERVIVHLHDVERRGPSEIALLLGATIADVERSLAKGRAVLVPPDSGASSVDAFRQGDVWFDDAMRAEARARIGGPVAPAEPAEEQQSPNDDPTRLLLSRRTMVGAGAAASIAALVGLGLWFGSADRDSATQANELPEAPDVTTSTSTRTTTSTTPPTPPTMPTLAVDASATDDTIILGNDVGDVAVTSSTVGIPETGFIIDPIPDGLQAAGGGIYQVDEARGWFQLWASRDAAHTNGRWLAVDVGPSDTTFPQFYGVNTHRMQFTGGTALVTAYTTGVLRIIAATSAGSHLELQSYGLVIDDLTGLIDGMTLTSDDEPVFSLGADAALDGMDLRISRAAGGFGVRSELAPADRGSWYWTPDGLNYVDIVAMPQQTDDLFATTVLTTPSTDPTALQLAPAGIIDLGGHQMLVRSFVADDGGNDGNNGNDPVIQWHAGNYTVTVSGSVELSVLFDVVAHVRLATPDEWEAQIQARPPVIETGANVGLGSGNVSVGKNTTTAGGTWDVQVSTGDLDESGQRGIQIGHGNGISFTPVTPDPSHPVTAFLSLDVTVLVGIFDSPGAVTAIRVTIEGREPVDVPLVRLGDTDSYGVGYAFSETADFSVALVASDGTVIQVLDV